MGSVARRAAELGAYLQIDEPCIADMPSGSVNEVLDSLFKKLPKQAIDEERVSIHVCTQVGKAHYDALMEQKNFSVLNIPFSGYQEMKNFDVITRESLEKNRKKLGVGFVSNTEVEDVKTAFKTLKKVSEKVGPENISLVNPFCGFFGTKPELVEPILANMKEASELFIKSLEGQ